MSASRMVRAASIADEVAGKLTWMRIDVRHGQADFILCSPILLPLLADREPATLSQEKRWRFPCHMGEYTNAGMRAHESVNHRCEVGRILEGIRGKSYHRFCPVAESTLAPPGPVRNTGERQLHLAQFR